MSVNKALLIGNVGSDPEIKTMQNGNKIANFSLATSERWKAKDGSQQEKTEWHRITIWNENLVRVVENFVKKGSKLYLEGQIETRKWQDQNGNDRYSTEIVLKQFNGVLQMLDSKQSGQSEPQINNAEPEIDDEIQF